MFSLSDYDYDLPPELIAQSPADPRDSCKLLILDRASGRTRHDVFRNLSRYLPERTVLLMNNSRVLPARIYGAKTTGGKVEFLLLSELNCNLWECLVRPGRRLPVGTRIALQSSSNGHSGMVIHAEIQSRNENGTRVVKFLNTVDIRGDLTRIGTMPLPPYIDRPVGSPDDYQTVYAKSDGSIAAPTAGLHFTPELLSSLQSNGTTLAEITLHVGWGTFKPVTSQRITEHRMEREWYSIDAPTAALLNDALKRNQDITAVGTTACRTLESITDGPVLPGSDWTNLFVYPGYRFKRVKSLITNFHLPCSTLLMLVSAFAGHDLILKSYREAITLGYRFYSFGDAMLIV